MAETRDGACDGCGDTGRVIHVQASGDYCATCFFNMVDAQDVAVVHIDELGCEWCGDSIDVYDVERGRVEHNYHMDDHSCSDNCDGPHAYCTDCGDEVWGEVYCSRHKTEDNECESCGEDADYKLCVKHMNEELEEAARNGPGPTLKAEDDGSMVFDGMEIRF